MNPIRTPKFSIVIPTLNQGNFIEETINSILDQHGVETEIIVIDGGSIDKTQEIIKKYESHLKFWISEKDFGQSDAINKGMKHVTGNLVNWLNSDDVLKPNALLAISQKWAECNGAGTCYFGGTELRQGNTDLGTFVFPQRHADIARTAICSGGYQPAIYFRSDVLLSLLPLDQTLHFSMDFDLWIRFVATHGIDKIQYLDNVLVSYRLHDKSKTVSQSAKFLRDNYTIAKRIAKPLNSIHMEEVLTHLEPNFQAQPSTAQTNRYDFPNINPTQRALMVEELLIRSITPVQSKKCFKLLRRLCDNAAPNTFQSKLIAHPQIKPILAHRYWWIYRLAQIQRAARNFLRHQIHVNF